MRQISLKWHIFLFYVVLGFIPMVAVSYFAVTSYTRSINTLTDAYLTRLVRQTAEQTESLWQTHFKYLDILVKFPYVQLSFQQYPSEGQLGTVQERLEAFRVNTESFDRITLYANDGHIVATTPLSTSGVKALAEAAVLPLPVNGSDYRHVEQLSSENPSLLLYKRVYDYRNPGRSVGVVGVEVAMEKFLAFIRQLNLGPGIGKTVTADDGPPIYLEARPEKEPREIEKEFSAHLPFLGWTISVLVPESLLFEDVDRLAFRIFLFAAFVALMAVAASLAASRVAIKPVYQIIAGIKEFASGNLAHRIRGIYGVETRRLAAAFNTMAEELQTRQEELIQADKLASLGLLSAGFAHEVRNPLAGIKTSAQVIAKHSPSAEAKNLATGIAKEVDRLNKLVADLLQFSRPTPAERKPCDLVDIINRSLEILDYEIRKKKVRVINSVARHRVFLAPDQMVQVLINLILNALEAVEAGEGVIRLNSKVAADGTLTMVVSDNGRGIAREKLPRVFDPFFSISKEGTGLGLSVVHLLLANNGIRVDVESTEGEGTAFLMHFGNESFPASKARHG